MQKVEDILENFEAIINKPEDFLNCNDSLSNKIKTNLKETYDYSKSEEIKNNKSNALPELIVKGFDNEQIWQQLELQNDFVLTSCLAEVSRLIVNKEKLIFKNIQQQLFENDNEEVDDNDKVQNMDENMQTKEKDSSDESDYSLHDGNEKFEENSSDSEKDENEFSSDKKPGKKSIVDDDFFKLSEMETFLNAEEKKLNEPDSGNDSEDESESESVDFFKGDENSDEEENKIKVAKYKDFFRESDDKAVKKPKRNKFLDELSDEDDENLSDDEDVDNQMIKDIKSTLEQRQERLRQKIDEIEENAISEKPWQLKGEITAENRPQNSLLEEVVEFDLTSRPAPVITEQTTLQLEDIIRQRIKDKVFDSVERKARPVQTPLEYKKKLVLDQEKSKESLAKIYEKEYLEQQEALTNSEKPEVEPEAHKEINKLLKSLFNKLDALSNFHFTPKRAVPDVKIVSNLPAISMEEVAPVAASDAALLAPEEVKGKTKGDIIGKSERTATDKKRERRKKKQKQRFHANEKAKREAQINKMRPGLGNKYSKEKAKKMMDKVAKEKNVDKMDESMKGIKSSKEFFTQLQDEVQSAVKGKVSDKKKKNKNLPQAKKLKL